MTVTEIDALIEQTRAALSATLAGGAPLPIRYKIGDREIERKDLLYYLKELYSLRQTVIDSDPFELETIFDDPNF